MGRVLETAVIDPGNAPLCRTEITNADSPHMHDADLLDEVPGLYTRRERIGRTDFRRARVISGAVADRHLWAEKAEAPILGCFYWCL